jgi:hypothetical protein
MVIWMECVNDDVITPERFREVKENILENDDYIVIDGKNISRGLDGGRLHLHSPYLWK